MNQNATMFCIASVSVVGADLPLPPLTTSLASLPPLALQLRALCRAEHWVHDLPAERLCALEALHLVLRAVVLFLRQMVVHDVRQRLDKNRRTVQSLRALKICDTRLLRLLGVLDTNFVKRLDVVGGECDGDDDDVFDAAAPERFDYVAGLGGHPRQKSDLEGRAERRRERRRERRGERRRERWRERRRERRRERWRERDGIPFSVSKTRFSGE